MRSLVLASAALLALTACAPDPNFPRPDGGPPSAWTAYWTVPSFTNIPMRGPETATGIIFWSHGVKGKEVQYLGAPPLVIRDLADRGWDVIKINRNNLFENDWSNAGLKHVADLERRIGEAKAQGYKRVIAAGQSYGGAISLEAGKRRGDLFAVLAFSPGHGSDAATGASAARLYENLIGLTVAQINATSAQRLWVSLPSGDYLMPDEGRSLRAKAALDRTGKTFYLVGEDAPVRGHGAVSTFQYRQWYGKCLIALLDPNVNLPPGRIACDVPNPAPTFIYPTNLAVKRPVADLPRELASFSGRWVGAYEQNRMELEVIVEDIRKDGATVVVVNGPGPERTFSMGNGRFTARIENQSLHFSFSGNRPIVLTHDQRTDTATLTLTVTNSEGRQIFKANLVRKKDT